MTIEEILHGENQYVEFKGTRPEAKKYMKTIVAFANGKGGRLVFGVEDETIFRNRCHYKCHLGYV